VAWDLGDVEFDAVLELQANRRYDYFVKRAASHGALWSLRSEDGWVVAEEGGEPYLPVWPHRGFAEANAVEAWAGAEAHAIDVDDFTLAWTRKLEDDGMKVAVFPTPDAEGTSVSPARLRTDLEGELEQFGP
jgi:Protein of unknown function (DUF2750)